MPVKFRLCHAVALYRVSTTEQGQSGLGLGSTASHLD